MIRRGLLRLVNRLARRHMLKIERVGDMLARSANGTERRIQVEADGAMRSVRARTIVVKPGEMVQSDSDYTRDIHDWYLRGSDE